MPQTNLPIWQIHGAVLQAIRDANRLVLVAPTGSGKTTQVPQCSWTLAWRDQKK